MARRAVGRGRRVRFQQARRLERRHRQHGRAATSPPLAPTSASEPTGAPVTTRSPSDAASASVSRPTPPFGRTNIGVGVPRRARAHRRLRAADQAPLRRLPRHELRERRARRQPVDVARVEPGEERRRRPCRSPRRRGGGAAARRASPRSRPSACPANEILSARRRPGRDTPGQRSTSPTSPGIPNGASFGNAHQPASVHRNAPVAPGATSSPPARARDRGRPPTACARRTSRPRSRARGRRPRRCRACRPAGRDASSTVTSTPAAGQPVRRGRARRPRRRPRRRGRRRVIPPAPPPGAPATTSASTSRNVGSAFGIARPREPRRRPLGDLASPRCPGRRGSPGGRRRTRRSTRPPRHVPRRELPRITSSTGGPHHGSAVRPALCHAIR